MFPDIILVVIILAIGFWHFASKAAQKSALLDLPEALVMKVPVETPTEAPAEEPIKYPGF